MTLKDFKRLDRLRAYGDRKKTLAFMGYMTYADYLASDLWKSIKRKAFLRNGTACIKCKSRASALHHSSYDRETMEGKSLLHLHPVCKACHTEAEVDPAGEKRSLEEANAILGITGPIERMRTIATGRPVKKRPEGHLCAVCGKVFLLKKKVCKKCRVLDPSRWHVPAPEAKVVEWKTAKELRAKKPKPKPLKERKTPKRNPKRLDSPPGGHLTDPLREQVSLRLAAHGYGHIAVATAMDKLIFMVDGRSFGSFYRNSNKFKLNRDLRGEPVEKNADSIASAVLAAGISACILRPPEKQLGSGQ